MLRKSKHLTQEDQQTVFRSRIGRQLPRTRQELPLDIIMQALIPQFRFLQVSCSLTQDRDHAFVLARRQIKVAFKIIKRAGEMTQVRGLGFDSSSSNSSSQLSVTAVPTPLNPSENPETTGSAFSRDSRSLRVMYQFNSSVSAQCLL